MNVGELRDKYYTGRPISAGELNTPVGLKLYGETIHDEWLRGKATKQLTLNEEVVIQRVLSPEQKRLQEIRTELDKLTHLASVHNLYGRGRF